MQPDWGTLETGFRVEFLKKTRCENPKLGIRFCQHSKTGALAHLVVEACIRDPSHRIARTIRGGSVQEVRASSARIAATRGGTDGTDGRPG